jgi:dolichol kinase
MSVTAQVTLAFGSVAVLLGLMALVRRFAGRVGLSSEVQRKLVHVGTGLFAMILPWLFQDGWPVYMLIAFTLVVMAILRLPRFSGGLGRTLHGVGRTSYGDFFLALAVGLCFFLAKGNTLFYVLPIAVLTLADAAAALAGTAYGTKLFRVEESQKSVEGSAVFFGFTLVIALVCLMLLSDLPVTNVIVLSLMVAAFGTLVEAQSWRGYDNLFVPLGLLVFLSVHSQSSLSELLWLTVLFVGSVVGFRTIGKRFGLTRHASRVYVVTMFLVLAVTAAQNAILPALVLMAHAWASITNPSDDPYGDLDIVAAIALLSFGWLALGNATGWNAVSFYGLSATGLAMGLSAIALRGDIKSVFAVAVTLLVIRAIIVLLNPPAADWAEPLWGLAVVCVVICGVAPMLASHRFARNRVFKLTLLALIPALGYYVVAVLRQAEAASMTGLAS